MKYEVVAEGNANIILRRNDDSLIRVSKNGSNPSKVAEDWNSFWFPKLGQYMGDLKIIHDPTYGRTLWISEIGSSRYNSEVVAEFKPKWLHQSPNAPSHARRCRTCAIKSLRQQPLIWCSLGLREKDARSIDLLVEHIVEPKHQDGVRKLLMESSIIDDIADAQLELADDICHCMSLRDCSILIEYSEHRLQPYKAFIVDLDPKDWKQKAEKWKRIESELQAHYMQPSDICIVSRP